MSAPPNSDPADPSQPLSFIFQCSASPPTADPNDAACLARQSLAASVRPWARMCTFYRAPTDEEREKNRKKREEKEKRKEEEREKGEAKKLFGGTLAKVLNLVERMKIDFPDVPVPVLEQEAWKQVLY